MKIERIGFLLIFLGLVIALVFTFLGNFIIADGKFSPDVLLKYGGFIGGTVGSIFSLAGYLLIYEGLRINKINQFENSFFNILNNFQDFRTNHIGLVIEGWYETEYTKRGQDFFEYLYWKQINPQKLALDQLDVGHITKQLKVHMNQLSHYYGLLDAIVRKIETSQLDNNEEEFYRDYIFNILNEHEKFLIANNHLLFEEKFKWLTEFKNKNKDQLPYIYSKSNGSNI